VEPNKLKVETQTIQIRNTNNPKVRLAPPLKGGKRWKNMFFVNFKLNK